jgi:hypothetical protein
MYKNVSYQTLAHSADFFSVSVLKITSVYTVMCMGCVTIDGVWNGE